MGKYLCYHKALSLLSFVFLKKAHVSEDLKEPKFTGIKKNQWG